MIPLPSELKVCRRKGQVWPHTRQRDRLLSQWQKVRREFLARRQMRQWRVVRARGRQDPVRHLRARQAERAVRDLHERGRRDGVHVHARHRQRASQAV